MSVCPVPLIHDRLDGWPRSSSNIRYRPISNYLSTAQASDSVDPLNRRSERLVSELDQIIGEGLHGRRRVAGLLVLAVFGDENGLLGFDDDDTRPPLFGVQSQVSFVIYYG